MEEIFKKIKSLLVGGTLLFVFFCVSPMTVQAATLYFSPSLGSHVVDDTFLLNVYISSSDQAMNAASGIISFPADRLEIVSLSKNDSIFSLWVQEPSFSNSAGTVNFEGIVLNPGFTGSGGKVISINFRAKTLGDAILTFSSSSVLANDGKGTNILTSVGNMSFNINAPIIDIPTIAPQVLELKTPSPEIAGVPLASIIFSPTHPNPEKWYNSLNPKFTWQVPDGVTAVRLLYDKYPNSQPKVFYGLPIYEKQLEDFQDGIWYFHSQLRNANGWGGISHFRFQIDNEKPTNFDITEIERKDLTDPRAKFMFDASDKTSGIDHYEVQINNGDLEVWQDNGTHTYETPLLGSGKYTLLVKAMDKAGNFLVNLAEFTIEALESPIITDCLKELQSGEILIVKGKTKYPDAQINLWLQYEKDETKNCLVKSDKDGNFTFVSEDRLSSGVYAVWVEVIDVRGAKSNPSEKVTISVEQSAFIKIGSWAVGFLAVIIPLVVLVFALLFVVWYGWHKFGLFRKKLGKIKKEVREAESVLHKAFNSIKKDLRKQIKLLEKTRTKRKLTKEEEKIVKQLRKNLNDAEKSVRKEIKDIEKEAK